MLLKPSTRRTSIASAPGYSSLAATHPSRLLLHLRLWSNRPATASGGLRRGDASRGRADERDRRCRRPAAGVAIADLVAGLLAAQGIVLALYARDRTGRGQQVDVGMLPMISLLTYHASMHLTTATMSQRVGNTRQSRRMTRSRRQTGAIPRRGQRRPPGASVR